MSLNSFERNLLSCGSNLQVADRALLDSLHPLSPLPSCKLNDQKTDVQKKFIQEFESLSGAKNSSEISKSTVNYSKEYLEQVVKTLTKVTVTSATSPAGDHNNAYPAARRLLAGWFSLLTPEEQNSVKTKIDSFAPDIDYSVLASQEKKDDIYLSGSNPTSAAMAETKKIPPESLKDALLTVVNTMNIYSYESAGKLAMNSQLTDNLITNGIAEMSFLLSYVKETIK